MVRDVEGSKKRPKQLLDGRRVHAHAGIGDLDLDGAVLPRRRQPDRSEEYTSELQSQSNLVCRLLLEKKKTWRDANHWRRGDSFYSRLFHPLANKLIHLTLSARIYRPDLRVFPAHTLFYLR